MEMQLLHVNDILNINLYKCSEEINTTKVQERRLAIKHVSIVPGKRPHTIIQKLEFLVPRDSDLGY